MTDYLYKNEHPIALPRLQGLEQIEDPDTIEQLTNIGVGVGGICLEIGAGAGSIAYWLADYVGKEGHVVATDLQPSLLNPAQCEVWRHDIREEELPQDTFDLVHMRHTLIHIPRADHQHVLGKIRHALKPGGSLLVEESDFSTWQVRDDTPEPLRSTYAEGVQAVLSVYAEREMDVLLGQHLAALVERVGFQITRISHRARDVVGGSAEAIFHQQTFRQLAASIRNTHSMATAAVERFAECFEDPRLAYRTRTTVAVSAIRS
jgi:ubiquinone/menaquinone biosynthesis C-methylase UbiE